MSVTEKVCPRCGALAPTSSRFCSECGLDLASQYVLPTRAEWVARQLQTEDASAQPRNVESGVTAPAPEPSTSAPGPLLVGTRRRDVLIGAGGLTFAVAEILATVAALLLLLNVLHSYLPAGLPVGRGLDLVAQLAQLVGVTVLASGFLVDSDRRWVRLAAGALLVALGAASKFAGVTTIAVEFLVHHGPGKISASYIIEALAAVPVSVGALIAWRAFVARRGQPAQEARRDRRLVATSVAFLGAAVLTAIAAILLLDLYSGVSLIPSGYTTALGFEIAGQFIIAAGLVVGAVALSRSGPSEIARVTRRDGLLWIAVAIASVGYLIQFIAGVAGTSSGSGIVLGGKELTAAWLKVFQALASSGALVCAGLGFLMSARARR